jgi:hypothetical protein
MRLHPLRSGDAEQAQCVRERNLRRTAEVQPGLRQRGVLRDDPAVAIEGVKEGREILRVAGQPVRCAQPRGDLDDLGQLADRAEEVDFARVLKLFERDVLDRCEPGSLLLGIANDRCDPRVYCT